jgi:hypothetical protein
MRRQISSIVATLVLIALLGLCISAQGQSLKITLHAHFPHFKTLKQAENWCAQHLRYQNDDPWDPAPNLEIVFDNGYGDCKMLAGAVYEVLQSVGQDSKIVTIKRQSWHMFVIYNENANWRVIDNAKLRRTVYANLDQIKAAYHVNDFARVSNSYDEFREWFNKEIYSQKK